MEGEEGEGGNWLLVGFAAAAAAVIDAGIVKLIHVSPAAGEAAKSIKESTDSMIPSDFEFRFRFGCRRT